MEQIRRIVDSCSALQARAPYTPHQNLSSVHPRCVVVSHLAARVTSTQGFAVSHSMGGGTGSGLGALLLEEMRAAYPRQNQL
jgi:hypothetical protein